jgi:hypothetical protein
MRKALYPAVDVSFTRLVSAASFCTGFALSKVGARRRLEPVIALVAAMARWPGIVLRRLYEGKTDDD